jgi:uncharacterized membrane protein
MLEFLHHLFGAVCGQEPDHTYAPGGILLPCCQRCLGLYAGAAIAALLHLCLRPQLTRRFLQVHGGFLVLMVPFGFHWLPQGPVLRTISGLFFGFAVFTFLWLPMSRRFPGRGRTPRPMRPSRFAYAIGLAATAALLPLLAAYGGRLIAYALSVLVFFGLSVLAAVICGDVALALTGTIQLLHCRPHLSRHEYNRERVMSESRPED